MTALTDREAGRRFIICAHRGDHNFAENSPAAIRSAFAKGCDRVEVDCRRSAEGTWWLNHNDISGQTDAQLAASGKCSLVDAFKIADQFGGALHLDIKEDATGLATFISSNGYGGRCIFGGSSQSQMDDVKAVDSGLTCMGYEWNNIPQGTITSAAYCDDQAPVLVEAMGSGSADDIQQMWDRHCRGYQTDNVDASVAKRAELAYGGVIQAVGGGTGEPGTIYRLSASATDTISPHAAGWADLSSMAIIFTLPADADVLISCDVRLKKATTGHRARFRLTDNGSQIAPDNETQFSGFYSWYVNEASGQQAHFQAVQTLTAGEHLLKVQHQAALGTSAVSFYDRSLVIQVLP